jgi:hypothetical protein
VDADRGRLGRALGLDGAVFGDASDRIVAAWRARAARMYPSDFADCGDPVRYTLLAALCWTRQAELVDGRGAVRRAYEYELGQMGVGSLLANDCGPISRTRPPA